MTSDENEPSLTRSRSSFIDPQLILRALPWYFAAVGILSLAVSWVEGFVLGGPLWLASLVGTTAIGIVLASIGVLSARGVGWLRASATIASTAVLCLASIAAVRQVVFFGLGAELWWLLVPFGTVVAALRVKHVRWTASQAFALGVAPMFAWAGARPAQFQQPANRVYLGAKLRQYQLVVERVRRLPSVIPTGVVVDSINGAVLVAFPRSGWGSDWEGYVFDPSDRIADRLSPMVHGNVPFGALSGTCYRLRVQWFRCSFAS